MNLSQQPRDRIWILALTLLCLIAGAVFRDYLMLKHIFFFKGVASDTLNINYPFANQISDCLSKYGIPKWSFNYGMGQNLFPFFLRDPFDIFLYPGGTRYFIYGTAYKEAIKIILSGFIFFYYLKSLNLSPYTSITGSLLFAFCGFMIVGCCWYIFSFEAFNMALLLLSFELLFTKQKWYLFPIAVALIGISQPFNLYVYGIFIAAYALLRHIQGHTFTFRAISSTFLKMICLGMTGLLLSAPFLLQNVLQLLNSPRGSGANSYAHSLLSSPAFALADKMQIGTSILRFFSNDITGTGLDYRGYHNYLEGPVFYCGLPCLLLLPQFFVFQKKRTRLALAIFLAVWMLPIIFPYFRYMFWLFTGNYYRAYSLFVAFFVLYYSLQALDLLIKGAKINITLLIITIGVLLGLLHYPFFTIKEIPAGYIVKFVSIMLLIYCILLCFMFGSKNSYLRYVFLGFVVLELIHLSRITVNNMDAYLASDLAYKGGYNDYTVEALNYIKPRDTTFYRIDKTYSSSYTYFPTYNDGMAQGYRGTREYSSFNQKYYILYLQLMGIANRKDEVDSRWAYGLIDRPILESENRVKYIFTNSAISDFRKRTCDSFNISGLVVLRNRFVLPFGYTYGYFIKESAFDKLSNGQKDIVSLRACVLNDKNADVANGLKEFQLNDTCAVSAFNNDIYRQYNDSLSRDTLALTKFDETHICGAANAGADKIMYFSVPYDLGWQLKVDGKKQDKIIVDAGMTGVYLRKGHHTIDMVFELPFMNASLLLCLLGILFYAGIICYNRKSTNPATSEI